MKPEELIPGQRYRLREGLSPSIEADLKGTDRIVELFSFIPSCNEYTFMWRNYTDCIATVRAKDVECWIPRIGEEALFWDEHCGRPRKEKMVGYVCDRYSPFYTNYNSRRHCKPLPKEATPTPSENVMDVTVTKCGCIKAGLTECLIENTLKQWGCLPDELCLREEKLSDGVLVWHVEKKEKPQPDHSQTSTPAEAQLMQTAAVEETIAFDDDWRGAIDIKLDELTRRLDAVEAKDIRAVAHDELLAILFKNWNKTAMPVNPFYARTTDDKGL